MRLFVPKLWDRVGLLLLVLFWDVTSRVHFAESRLILHILERWEASISLGLLAWSALAMMSSRYIFPLVDLA